MTFRGFVLSAGAAVCALTPAARADAATQIFSFTEVDPSANLGSGPFGQVTVTENAGALDFVMTLASGYRIHRGNANHLAFTFSLAGNPQVSITGLPAGFSPVSLSQSTNVTAPPFAPGQTGIKCEQPACGPGWGGGYSGPLSFKVMSSTSALTLNSLIARVNNQYSVYFTTDVVDSGGDTGNVGAVMVNGAVPEPSTWALMILGFGAAGGAMRRERKARRSALPAG
jgi:hypothetical protein